MTRYDYNELKNAVKRNPTQENIEKLVSWFENYGNEYWNGECYDADELGCIYPIYAEPEIIGYELR